MSGLALIQYGNSLDACTHLTDATYDVVVGSWSKAAKLATCHGESYAYTVTTAGVDPAKASEYVILDPTGTSGLTGALSPGAYVAKCAALKANHPGLDGIFLDNTEQQVHGLQQAIPAVSKGLAAHGLKWCANAGWYVAGNVKSNDGTLWREWVATIGPYFRRLVLERWMEASQHVPPVLRKRGPAWYQLWDQWQECVAAAPGKFIGVTYGSPAWGVYGRASMLTALDANPGNCFYCNTSPTGPDPYGQVWQAKPTAPHVDPVAGTARLY